MALNGCVKEYKIPSSFIGSAGNVRQFQQDMVKFAEDREARIALLSAPTASGKTYGFKLMGNIGKTTIIVFPNNLLSRETLLAFQKTGISDVALLNAHTINELLRTKRELGSHDFTQRKAIGLILSDKRYIITNPTVFYFLLTNHYRRDSKEDTLTELIRNNLSMVIFDEFHVYSRDQVSMILASTLLLRDDVKTMFSSATLPKYLFSLLREMYGQDQVREIIVKRTQKNTQNHDLLQGPINIHIFKGPAVQFIKDNLELFETGKWFIILDSIKNIHDVFSELRLSISQSEIMMISAYHDPSYEAYDRLKRGIIDRRIVIGSNIIEQGINPPPEYSKFLIEPGYSQESLIQRVGRIGREKASESDLYVSLQSTVDTFPDKIDTVDDIFDFLGSFRFRMEPTPWLKSIGVYLWLVLSRLSRGARNAVFENLLQNKKFGQLLASAFETRNLDNKLLNNSWVAENAHYIRNLKEISEWWTSYKNSIYNFIPSEKEVEVLDTSDEFDDSLRFYTVYSKLWVRKNERIIDEDDGIITVKGFLDKPDFNFDVYVYGLPFISSARMHFGDIYFSARTEIIERFDKICKNWFNIPEQLKNVMESLRSCIWATAGLERVRIELP